MKRNVLFFVVALIASVALISCDSSSGGSNYSGGSNVSFRGSNSSVQRVTCYTLNGGDYVQSGQIDVKLNSNGTYSVIRGNSSYTVYKTSYPDSKYFNSKYSDEWGYTYYFDL